MIDRCIDHFRWLVLETARGLRECRLSVPTGSTLTAQRLSGELVDFHDHRLMPIQRRLENTQGVQGHPYRLALVGLSNVGKSTILHAVLGEDVTVRGAGPTTPFRITYTYSDLWTITRAGYGGRGRETFGSARELAASLAITVKSESLSEADLRGLVVTGPMELLRQGLEVTDTPGFGAAQVGQSEGQHQAVLDKLLENLDSWDRILMCVAASDAYVITPVEPDYYKRLGERCFDVVVNKWRGDQAEQAQFKARYQPLFPGASFHFVNARKEVADRPAESSEGAGDAVDEKCDDHCRDGAAALVGRILREARDPAGRVRAFDEALADAWRDVTAHLRRYYRLPSIPWDELALARLQDDAPPESSLGRALQGMSGGSA